LKSKNETSKRELQKVILLPIYILRRFFVMKRNSIGLEELLAEFNENIMSKPSSANLGIVTITRKDLEELKASNKKANIKMTGILTFTEDITPDLVKETIESVKVRGTIKASPKVQEVLNTLLKES
jgi:hypothetical protein